MIAGYVSPGHDRYLRLKWGDAAPRAAERLALLRSHLADHPWLEVDPWEALHRSTSVNFTDVTSRLERYLRAHVDPRVEVAFVCGGDNARFSLAFARRGRCVVVGRPGSEAEVARWRADPRVASAGGVLWAACDVAAASSSMTPPGARTDRTLLRLRLEGQQAVRSLGLTEEVWRTFQGALVARLAGVAELTMMRAADQPSVGDRPTISLDPMTLGTVDVGVSRLYDCGGTGHLGYVARPGWRPVEEQLADVTPGRWTIVEDDRMTGGTLRFVTERLPDGVEIADVVLGMPEGVGGDIADSRDFLLGSNCGGLVLELPDGSVGRAPYVLPYVDPHARCGVMAADAVAFSRDVWALNAAAFEGTGLRVSDLDDAHAAVLRQAGRSDDELLVDVCRWHQQVLDGLITRDATT